jgi:hypothetical protein
MDDADAEPASTSCPRKRASIFACGRGQMDSRLRGHDVRDPGSGTEAWMASKQPAVYIVASGERATLYIGVTGNLKLRAWEHRESLVGDFTKRHGVKRFGVVRVLVRLSFGHRA